MSAYPYSFNSQPQLGYVPQGFSCKPVTSREEAMCMSTNFNGLGDIMPDLGHEMIYLKRFNTNTGMSDFLEFQLVPPKPPEKPQEYATVQMLNDAMQVIKDELAALGKAKKKVSDKNECADAV